MCKIKSNPARGKQLQNVNASRLKQPFSSITSSSHDSFPPLLLTITCLVTSWRHAERGRPGAVTSRFNPPELHPCEHLTPWPWRVSDIVLVPPHGWGETCFLMSASQFHGAVCCAQPYISHQCQRSMQAGANERTAITQTRVTFFRQPILHLLHVDTWRTRVGSSGGQINHGCCELRDWDA